MLRAGQRRLHRGDVDDLAGAARDHVPRHRLADVEDRGDVGAHQPLEGVGREILERGAVLHAGVVDQDVDRARRRLEAVDGRAGRRRGRWRRRRARRTWRRAARRRGGGGGELGGVAAVQHHARAGGGEAFGQRVADALARAGHQRALARQVEEFEPCRHVVPPEFGPTEPGFGGVRNRSRGSAASSGKGSENRGWNAAGKWLESVWPVVDGRLTATPGDRGLVSFRCAC